MESKEKKKGKKKILNFHKLIILKAGKFNLASGYIINLHVHCRSSL